MLDRWLKVTSVRLGELFHCRSRQLLEWSRLCIPLEWGNRASNEEWLDSLTKPLECICIDRDRFFGQHSFPLLIDVGSRRIRSRWNRLQRRKDRSMRKEGRFQRCSTLIIRFSRFFWNWSLTDDRWMSRNEDRWVVQRKEQRTWIEYFQTEANPIVQLYVEISTSKWGHRAMNNTISPWVLTSKPTGESLARSATNVPFDTLGQYDCNN